MTPTTWNDLDERRTRLLMYPARPRSRRLRRRIACLIWADRIAERQGRPSDQRTPWLRKLERLQSFAEALIAIEQRSHTP